MRRQLTREVVLVTGPPCAGKSTLVLQHAQPDDRVLCVDTFAQNAGSPVTHNHAGRMYRAGEDRFWTEVDQVRRNRFIRAWIIRCAPAVQDRRELAWLAGATHTVVLTPPVKVLYRRAMLRDHPADATLRAIDSWYRRYTPGRGETVLTG